MLYTLNKRGIMSEKNANNVDQIRDLIFGSQIKDFEEKFEHLSASLKSTEEAIRRSFDDTQKKLEKETERALSALEKKIDNLSSTTHKERTKLKELISTTNETLQDTLHNQKDEFDMKLSMFKENIADENEKMTHNMKTIKEEIFNTLEAKIAPLSDAKLSRDAISQMLLDLAMKIQGTDVNTLLKQDDHTEK